MDADYQYRIKYLGPIGSYSYEVAKAFEAQLPQEHSVLLEPQKNLSAIFAEDACEFVTYCIIPLENSTSGDVYETYKNLYQHNIELVGAYILDIHHVLIGYQDATISDIKQIYSHPQALMQVDSFTTKQGWEAIPYFSTADAVRLVSETADASIAAIASRANVELFDNVKILKESISNNEANFTRFLIYKQCPNLLPKSHYFSYQPIQATKPQNWLLLVEFDEDKSGQLNNLLAVIAQYEINLNNIKSRPVSGERFKYFFILEAEFQPAWDETHHRTFFNKLTEQTKTLKYYVY